jgi:Porin subfamily
MVCKTLPGTASWRVTMRIGKSLLLGSAAGLMAVSAGQAADLPVKAKPVEYVKVCSLYGAGFFYIPGTDKCIKLGGYFREQWDIHGAGDAQAYMTTAGATWTRTGTSDSSFRTRTLFSIDVREQSAYGTIRGYTAFGAQQTTPNDQNSAIFFNRSFVQFAGFTGGRAVSFFDFISFDPYGYSNIRANLGNTGATGIDVFAYTWQLGNGAAFTVSAEDACAENNTGLIAGVGRQCQVYNGTNAGSMAPGTAAVDSAGYNIPDVVAALRVDQAWGSAQVMGAYHRVAGGYYSASSTFNQNFGHPGDQAGWAAGAGFILTNFLGMQGDSVGVQGNFSEGAMSYVTNGVGALVGYSGGSNGLGNSVGFAHTVDGIFSSGQVGLNGCTAAGVGTSACGTSIELTTGWTVAGYYQHQWTPQWKTSVYGGYVSIKYDDTAAQYYCAYVPGTGRGSASTVAGGLGQIVSSCDPNNSYWNAGTRTQWNPNSNLDLGVDFMWTHLNTANSGIAALTNPPTPLGARPNTVGGSLAAPNATWYNISNYDVYTVALRAQYNFLP